MGVQPSLDEHAASRERCRNVSIAASSPENCPKQSSVSRPRQGGLHCALCRMSRHGCEGQCRRIHSILEGSTQLVLGQSAQAICLDESDGGNRCACLGGSGHHCHFGVSVVTARLGRHISVAAPTIAGETLMGPFSSILVVLDPTASEQPALGKILRIAASCRASSGTALVRHECTLRGAPITRNASCLRSCRP